MCGCQSEIELARKATASPTRWCNSRRSGCGAPPPAFERRRGRRSDADCDMQDDGHAAGNESKVNVSEVGEPDDRTHRSRRLARKHTRLLARIPPSLSSTTARSSQLRFNVTWGGK